MILTLEECKLAHQHKREHGDHDFLTLGHKEYVFIYEDLNIYDLPNNPRALPSNERKTSRLC